MEGTYCVQIFVCQPWILDYELAEPYLTNYRTGWASRELEHLNPIETLLAVRGVVS